jgi:hypothetical protein
VLTNDTDVQGNSLTAVLVTGPAHGSLSLNAGGSFTHTPTSAYNGSDSFTYRAFDGTTNGNIATVTITHTIAPTAVDVQTTNDSLQVYNASNTGSPVLGTVNLGRQDYVTGLLGGNVRYGASGTASTMTMSADKKTVTVVLGTYNSTIIVDPARQAAGGTGTLTWTPTATPHDLAGNALALTPAVESGAGDVDF